MASRESELILLPYQQRWVNDQSPLKIWLAARQIGKSFALAMEAVTEALEARCNNLILSSSQRQSKEVMEKVYSHLRYLKVRSQDIIDAERETREEVRLPTRSRIISLPASPDTVRGFSGNVFLDEFAFHQDSRKIWQAMYPTVTRGFKVRVSSTPNGKQNMFYEIWSGAERDDKDRFSRHRTDIYEALREGLPVDIEALRAGIHDPDSWAQEYECKFIDEATAYITYEMISSCEDDQATMELPSEFAPEGELYLGVDIGRKRHLSVLWLYEKVGDVFWTRMVKELSKASFKQQRDILFGLMDGSALGGARIRRCCIDSSGLGMQLAEEAEERFGSRAEAVQFTGPVKEDLAVTLRRRFEDRQVRIPADRAIREDLHSVKKTVTRAGNVRFDAVATDDGHADRFWAGALAVHAGTGAEGPVEYESVKPREAVFGGAGCW